MPYIPAGPGACAPVRKRPLRGSALKKDISKFPYIPICPGACAPVFFENHECPQGISSLLMIEDLRMDNDEEVNLPLCLRALDIALERVKAQALKPR